MVLAKTRKRMHYPPLVLPKVDYTRLTLLIDSDFASIALSPELRKQWRARLQTATLVDGDPGGIVVMNSTVQILDVDSTQRETFTLVYPEQACIAKSRLSILTPIGMSLLGSRIGDAITWELPRGIRRMCIEQISG